MDAPVISSFTYRAPRVRYRLAVEFVVASGTLFGTTSNVSDRGLFIEFEEPLLPGTNGSLRLRYGHCLLELQAEVTHTEGFGAGLEFTFASDQECSFLAAIVQVITTEAARRSAF